VPPSLSARIVPPATVTSLPVSSVKVTVCDAVKKALVAATALSDVTVGA